MLGFQSPAHLSGVPVTDSDGAALIRTYKTWKGNNVFFLGGRIIFGPDALSILLTIFLITAPVTIFCVFVARKLVDVFPHNAGVSVLTMAIGLTVLDLIFLCMTSGRDPGIIPRNLYPPEPDGYEGDGEPRMSHRPPLRLPRTKDTLVNGITVKIKYCDTCMLYRPPRASHCSICNNCVERFDHHCPWLGQCIGARNYRFYFMFVFCSTLLCIYVHVFCWIYVRRIMEGEKISIWRALIKTPASIALIIYTFISVWFVGGLTGFHLYLIGTNQSTYENFRYRYHRHENPFNKGILGNFSEVFCSSISPSRNNFRAKILAEPGVPPRTVKGSGPSSPSLEKVPRDIEMGRNPVWHETAEEQLADKYEETGVVGLWDLSRMLPAEKESGGGPGIMHSREISNGFREDVRSREREGKRDRRDDSSDKDVKAMTDVPETTDQKRL